MPQLQTETLIGRAGYTRVLSAAAVSKRAREMHPVEIVDQVVLPIDQPSRFFLCRFLCLFQRRVTQPHILNRLSRSSEIIKGDLISIIRDYWVPRGALDVGI